MVISLMKPEHERQLRRLVMAYLKETFEQGGDFPPSLENAAAFVAYGLEGAAEGDPCLAALDDTDGKVIGFVMARGVHFPGMETRHRTVRSWGSFMHPEHRGHGNAVKLFRIAGRLAQQKGYTRFLGMTHGTGYEKNALHVVDKIPGMQVVGQVLMMDLTNMDCMVRRAPIDVGDDGVLRGGKVEPPADDVVPVVEVDSQE